MDQHHDPYARFTIFIPSEFLAKSISTVHIHTTAVADDHKVNYSHHEAKKHIALETQQSNTPDPSVPAAS